MYTAILRYCFTWFVLALTISCRTLMPQPPWIRPKMMPEILFQPGNMPRIVRVLCPTDGGLHVNVTWWKGSQLVAAGEELVFRPLESHHIGKYHCQAENTAGLSLSTEFEVSRVFLENETPTVHRLFLMEGQAASIPCPAPNGYPAPVVSWNSTNQSQMPRMVVDPNGTLHLQNADVRDHGTVLECSAKHLSKTYVIRTVQLTVHPRPQECFEEPRLMYATENLVLQKYTDALIYCVTSGPSSTISWTLPTGAKAAVSEFPSNHLRINSSTLAMNERSFQILCDNNGLTSKISVTLASAPMVHPLSNVSKIEGERVVFKCHVSGRPKPRIEWLFNGQPVDKRLIYEDEIVLPSVTFKDMGVYRCEAFNNFGRSHREVVLSVDSAEPHVVADTECFDTVVGDRIVIPCEARAFRAPKKTWFKNGMEIAGTSDDDSLELLDVQLADSGRYACRVCETHEHSRCVLYKFELKVFTSELLETPPKPMVVLENKLLNISCRSRFVDDVIVWRINGTFQAKGPIFQSAEPVPGTYTCELHRNDTLVKQWDGLVSVRRRTVKPKITKVSCDNGFAVLDWEPVQDAAFYEILHLQDSRRWQTAKFVIDTRSEVELSQCHMCAFRVSAHNEAGSTMSEVEQCVTPVRRSKILLISGVTVNRKRNAFRVSWTSPKQTNETCFRVCSYPSASCREVGETQMSFNISNTPLESFFTVSGCNTTTTTDSPGSSFPLKLYYNCNLTLEITDIQHLGSEAVKVIWKFAADQNCTLTGRLVIDDLRSYDVDLHAGQFLLEDLEPLRMHCLELKVFHGEFELRSSSVTGSCFQPGQGWEPLEMKPIIELYGGRIHGSLPANTLLFHSPISKPESWASSNVSTVDFTQMGDTLLKFVQKLNGRCKVSDVIVVREQVVIDWFLWLCGVTIVVGGVFITVTVFLRKKSYKADLY